MIEVRKVNYPRYYDFFSPISCYVGVLGVLDKVANGRVFIDDESTPSVGIVFTEDGYFIAGNLSDSNAMIKLNEFAQSDTFPEYAGLLVNSNQLNGLKTIFKQKLYDFVDRNSYELDTHNLNLKESKEIMFRLVNAENISELKNYTNYKTLYDSCMFTWGEYDKDLITNFCVVALQDKAIVSKCLPCHVSTTQNCCELDIETMKGFENQGFAIATVRKTINEVISRGINKIVWNCDKDNIGSNKIAKRLNFKKTGETHLIWFDKKL